MESKVDAGTVSSAASRLHIQVPERGERRRALTDARNGLDTVAPHSAAPSGSEAPIRNERDATVSGADAASPVHHPPVIAPSATRLDADDAEATRPPTQALTLAQTYGGP